VGMVSEPHPKPKAQLPMPTQPAPAKVRPANDAKGKLKKEQNETVTQPVPAVPSAKGTTQRQQYSPSQYRQLGQPSSTSLIQSGVQRHTYQQQQQQAYSGHARSSTTYSETQDEDEEDDEEEDSEEETDSDEEDEEDDEDEEQPDPRYNPQNKPQKHKRPMASIASGAGVPSQSLSWGYDQNFEEEMISTPTPKRKIRLKPKIKMNEMDPYTAYMDVNTTNGRKGRIVPRREGDEDITPKATKKNLKPKKRIPSENHVGFRAVKRHTVHLWDGSDDDGRGERKSFQAHERSRSAYEEREREVVVAKQRGGGGPDISVSGPVTRNLHSHYHAQSVSQQPQFGQQTYGRQARPAGGLICGGCNGSIIGRIVSAMGSRWHPACFRCTVCNGLLEHVSSYEHEGRPYCHLDYHEVRSSLR
jgi:LIM domain